MNVKTYFSKLLHRFARYFRLLFLFAKFSLMAQAEYRLNFFSGVTVECGYLLVKLSYVAVVTMAGVNIGGLSPDEIVIFIGTYILMTGIYMVVYPSFSSLSQKVREGSLDMLIVKPVSLQFMLSFQNIDFSMLIPNATAGIILIATGWHQADLPVTLVSVSGFVLFLLSGVFLTYSLFLLPHLLCFWLVSNRGIAEITAAVWDFNNMPQLIYGKWMQRLGTFILPVFIITNFPGLFLLDRLTPFLLFWGLAAPVLFFILCRLVFSRAVKHYTSAGG